MAIPSKTGVERWAQRHVDNLTLTPLQGSDRVPQIHVCLGPQNVAVSKPGSPQVQLVK